MQPHLARHLPLLLAPLAAAAPADVPLGKLLADDGSTGDAFGAVAVSGSSVLVGASRDDDKGQDSGSAYLFDLATQTQLGKLVASDGSKLDHFGAQVALGPSLAVIGASFKDVTGYNSGAAYVFDAVTGQELLVLVPSDGAEIDHFGMAVALSGTTVVVGAPGDDDGAQGAGSVYLFDGATGAQVNKLTARSPGPFDGFGESLATSGPLAIIGATGDDDAAPNAGAAYLFDLASGQQVGKLVAEDGESGDGFGLSVAIDGSLALVGAWLHDASGAERGAAYLFDVTTGEQLAKLTPDELEDFDRFGIGVALRGDRAVVGAYDDEHGTDAGATYVFDVADPSRPVLVTKLLPDPKDPWGFFGYHLAIEGGTVLVGASGDDENGAGSGSVYLFELPAQIGTAYCGPAVPNSSGAPGALGAYGSDLVVDNCVVLAGVDLAVDQFGLFLNSMTQGFANPPGSQGNLCLGGGIGRYSDDVLQTGAAGMATLQLDLTRTPTAGGLVAVQPGETWNFQLWFRDANPGTTSNFTDGVTISFK